MSAPPFAPNREISKRINGCRGSVSRMTSVSAVWGKVIAKTEAGVLSVINDSKLRSLLFLPSLFSFLEPMESEKIKIPFFVFSAQLALKIRSVPRSNRTDRCRTYSLSPFLLNSYIGDPSHPTFFSLSATINLYTAQLLLPTAPCMVLICRMSERSAIYAAVVCLCGTHALCLIYPADECLKVTRCIFSTSLPAARFFLLFLTLPYLPAFLPLRFEYRTWYSLRLI